MSDDQLKSQLDTMAQLLRDHGDRVDAQFRDQNQILGQLSRDAARNEERVKNTFERVFGAPGVPGLTQYWGTENEKRIAEITAIKVDVSALKQTSLTHRIYWAGIAAALGLLAKLGLSKAGIHF